MNALSVDAYSGFSSIHAVEQGRTYKHILAIMMSCFGNRRGEGKPQTHRMKTTEKSWSGFAMGTNVSDNIRS